MILFDFEYELGFHEHRFNHILQRNKTLSSCSLEIELKTHFLQYFHHFPNFR